MVGLFLPKKPGTPTSQSVMTRVRPWCLVTELSWKTPARLAFGPAMPDPNVPGLVVTLSTTPSAAGGPNANLAGVFQLNSVTSHQGLTRVITDWEVGVPGFFGKNKPTTLTAYLVKGTAPGIVTGHEQPISNVIHETFTIGR